MEKKYYVFNYIFHVFVPVTSNLTSFTEMDSFSRTLCAAFLTFESVKIIARRIPFLSGSRLLLPTRFTPLFPRVNNPSVYFTNKTVTTLVSPKKDLEQKEEMHQIKRNKPDLGSPRKKLKGFQAGAFSINECKGSAFDKKQKQRPNYFVAVQISDPNIHGEIQKIQNHIVTQNNHFNYCMISPATLHITLMVMYIGDEETHERAMKALKNVHEEYNDVMCKNPLTLEFNGLGHFRNTVLYAKMEENEAFEQLCNLAASVQKHFAAVEIFTTDQRKFNPHLTIAKIDFSDKKQRRLRKIEPSLYETFVSNYLGCEKIAGIQLLKMGGPKDDAGYYKGDNLMFELSSSSDNSEPSSLSGIIEEKNSIRMKIAKLTEEKMK